MKPLTEKDIRLTYQDAYYCGDEVIIATNKQEEVRAQILENQRIVKDIKKRIEEKKANLDNFDDNRKTYTLKDIIVSELEELQKIVEVKNNG